MSKKQLSRQEVIHIAKLANLPLQSNEVAKFQRQLSETLDYVQKLNEFKTESLEPTSHVTGLKNVLRGDKSTPSFSQKEALSGTKSSAKGMFKIEIVLEK